MLNLNTLFNASSEDKVSFIDNLNLEKNEKQALQEARTDIRNCLRSGIPVVLKNQGYEGEVPQPKFFTQGSWAYKTLNAPAQETQQADLDDGAYLPMTFMKQRKNEASLQVFFSPPRRKLLLTL